MQKRLDTFNNLQIENDDYLESLKSMTIDELSRQLKRYYDSAPARQKHVQVVLFGIVHARQLATVSVAEVVARSEIGKWGPQVSLGVGLANYVTPNP